MMQNDLLFNFMLNIVAFFVTYTHLYNISILHLFKFLALVDSPEKRNVLISIQTV